MCIDFSRPQHILWLMRKNIRWFPSLHHINNIFLLFSVVLIGQQFVISSRMFTFLQTFFNMLSNVSNWLVISACAYKRTRCQVPNLYPNRPYRLFTFDPMASFPCLPVLARQACAWRLHLMFPARICCFLILSPITNLSLNVLCTKHEDWCHTKTRLLGQKWINGKVYCNPNN